MIALLSYTLTRVVGRGTVFRYRLIGGEYPVSQRKTAIAALEENWGDRRAGLFNPPIDLLTVTLRKMKSKGARGLLLKPLWHETQEVSQLKRLANRVHILYPSPRQSLVTGARSGTATCPLLLAEVGLTLLNLYSNLLLQALQSKWPGTSMHQSQ